MEAVGTIYPRSSPDPISRKITSATDREKTMISNFLKTLAVAIALTTGTAASAAQFVVELAEPLTGDDAKLMQSLNVSEVERFDAESKSYVVLDAQDKAVLDSYFNAKTITPLKIKEVGFVNSPEVGGGAKAGADPRPGHKVYVIERPVPGIGDLPLETQKQLSMGSNAVLTKLGKGIEWAHSYLTDEGTYCVYRAADTDKIVEHGKLAEFPINKISAVVHTKVASE